MTVLLGQPASERTLRAVAPHLIAPDANSWSPRSRSLVIFRRLRIGFGMVVALMTMACSDPSASLSPDDRVFVCRAAIAALMGRPIGIVAGSESGTGRLVQASYRRPNDGTVWKNVCRFSGNRVIWAGILDDGSTGRWRDHALDSVVTFQLSGDGVSIRETYSDGASAVRSYRRDSDEAPD